MIKIVLVNGETKKVESVEFSGKNTDIFELIGEGVETIQDLVVGNGKKHYHILIDEEQTTSILPSRITIGGQKIKGNVIVCQVDVESGVFSDTTIEEVESFVKSFEFI